MRKTYTDSVVQAQQTILLQCQTMIFFALNNGKDVPGALVQAVQTIAQHALPAAQHRAQERDDGMGEPASSGIDAGGREPPAEPKRLDASELAALSEAHGKLAALVAPARPETLLTLFGPAGGRLGSFSRLPLLRWLLIAAGAFLLLFIISSLSSDVTTGGSDWARNSGAALLLNELFLLSAAGMGASFAQLYEVHKYVRDATYDASYEPIYWIRLVLGVTSGMIIAMLVDLEALLDSERVHFGQPTLAMLGGFSASAVYRILSRFVETLEALVRGDDKAQRRLAAEQARAGAEAERVRQNADMFKAVAAMRTQLSSANLSEEERKSIESRLDNLSDKLLP
ncbi:MAG: hypothetical protein GKR94_22330 [Gammaproteobacteria bacterium]|nr:hypothetical protein [Gammaproteobacteria bacterium]